MLRVGCVFVATESQVATVLSLASIPRRRQFTIAYASPLLGIGGITGIAGLSGWLRVSSADRVMLLFVVLSRLLALYASIVLIIRS